MNRLGVLTSLVALGGLQAACVQVPVPPRPGVEQRAAPIEPADPERRAALRLELASLYFSRGQTQTALDEVQHALQAKPNLGPAYALRGLIHAALGKLPEADADFRRALQLTPADGDVQHNYGWFLCQQGRFDEADQQFTRALAQPGYREPVRTLLAQGVCQARAGRWADAERTLLRSYELDPANPVTAYNLADVLRQRGELERARFYVGRINAVDALVTAQSLWLAARIDRRLGDVGGMQLWGGRLRDRFPQSHEALLYERGQFDD